MKRFSLFKGIRVLLLTVLVSGITAVTAVPAQAQRVDLISLFCDERARAVAGTGETRVIVVERVSAEERTDETQVALVVVRAEDRTLETQDTVVVDVESFRMLADLLESFTPATGGIDHLPPVKYYTHAKGLVSFNTVEDRLTSPLDESTSPLEPRVKYYTHAKGLMFVFITCRA